MEKKGNKKKMIQYILIGVFLVLIAVMFFLISKTNDSNTSKSEPETKKPLEEMSTDEILEYAAKCSKEKAYEVCVKAFEKDKESVELLKSLVNYSPDGSEKISYIYFFLDATTGKAEEADTRRTDFLYLIENAAKTDNDTAYDIAVVANEEFDGILKEAVDSGKVTAKTEEPVMKGDTIYFGSYPQNKIADNEVPEYIKSIKYDENGFAKVYGKKYAKVEGVEGDQYFDFSKLTWKVLSNDKDSYFVISEKVFDTQLVLDDIEDSTWDVTYLRKWLNSNLKDSAFSDKEAECISLTNIGEQYNGCYGLTAPETSDYLTLLKYDDVHCEDKADWVKWKAKATDYAMAKGTLTDDDGNSRWWLSTNGSNYKSYVFVNGNGNIAPAGEISNNDTLGVRPVMTVTVKIIEKADATETTDEAETTEAATTTEITEE